MANAIVILQQVEQNMKFDFSMTTEDGKELMPLFGPGYTGLKNLGNRYHDIGEPLVCDMPLLTCFTIIAATWLR